MRRGILAAFALLLAGAVAPGHGAPLPADGTAVDVRATPISHFERARAGDRFGTLKFRGGLVLSAPLAPFGGISAFRLDAAGTRFLAVSDAGFLLRGRIETDGDRITGLADVTAGPLRGAEGDVLAPDGRGDAESLAVTPDGVFIGFETVNEIRRYPSDPLGAPGVAIAVPAGVTALGHNRGLESLDYVRSGPLAGALLAVGERNPQPGGDLPGFIIGGPVPGTFSIRLRPPFDATDIAIGPDGMVYLLERYYSITTGVLMQIRRFPLADVAPGAVVEGEVLGRFGSGFEIDNMEAIAVTIGTDGAPLLTLLSDDNFNPLQRTILLRFSVARD